MLKSGADISWADNARKYLNQIEEDYIIPIGDDFFISRVVQTEAIKKAFELVLRDGIDWFGLILPKGDRYRDEQGIYFIDSHHEYCVSTSISIRKKDVFYSLLKPGFSAWDFEIRNSREVNESGISFWVSS